MTHVVLVDEEDNVVGTMEKMEAHRKGALHRAFSVLLFNSRRELLLQKRSLEKYHSGGLWTNTCCSHPLPDENIASAARRSLQHEMGIDLQPRFFYKFRYEANLDADLKEHELDHVFVGVYDGEPVINPDEVEEWKFADLETIHNDIRNHPQNYSSWFKIIIANPEFAQQLKSEGGLK